MRAREFVFEEELSSSIANLVGVVNELRSRTDQIRLDSLVNIVRKEPGSEMFNIDILKNAVEEGKLKDQILDIKKDEDTDVMYVYFKPILSDTVSDITSPEDDYDVKSPEKTVATMAKRAALSRT